MCFGSSVRVAMLALALPFASACDNDSSSGPSPQPVIGLSASALTSTSVRLTFNARVGDTRYVVQRAEGASATFEPAGTVDAPGAATQVTFTDAGLKVATAYRYRLVTVIGTSQSAPSGETSVTTLGLQNAAAEIAADITANRTLYADTVYTLKGFIHVGNGATLTIQPGTKIVGDFNTLGSSLWILRGARIQAVGTAQNPIVLTSSRPEGSRQTGDWGGLIIVGNAPISRAGTVEVEGSNQGVNNNYQVLYSGGTTPTDNSGTLSYVRVEFAGYAPALNTELNTFTFAAVGSGTRASYLQALGGLDDSFEFFGGGFDLDHLVAYETGDDMFDMSEGFQGRLQYLIGFNSLQLTPRSNAGSFATDLQGIENDGCEGSGCTDGRNSTPLTIPVVANFTLIGCGDVACVGASGGYGLMLRRGTGGYYVNGFVGRFPRGGISVRDAETYSRAGSVVTPDLTTSDLAVRNVVFTDVPALFQAASATQFAFDATANALTLSATPTVSLLTALPAPGSAPAGAGAFDWAPVAGSAIASGGMTTFAGKLATRATGFISGTSYVGAAEPGGTKWWSGWTNYARN